jgi:4,5-dihydroxyphthalate decarboxylase
MDCNQQRARLEEDGVDITIALERYERHVPFFTGEIKAPVGINLMPLEIGETRQRRDGFDRHHRMLRDLEFDVCEMSLGSYVLGLSRDPDFGMVGVPVFPRRYFSMSQIYVNAVAGIETPADLAGRNVGITAFQVTLSVLAKGDLKRDYNVAWQDVNWHCMRPEQLPIEFPDGVSVQRIPEGDDIGDMLVRGDIDALICPQRPERTNQALAAAGDKVRRLFSDPAAEDERYFRKYGYFPVMHLLAIRRDVAERVPELAPALIPMWEEAKRIAYDYYEDPAYPLLAWGWNTYQEQQTRLGSDVWPSGLAANRDNLQMFLDACDDQGLMERPLTVDEMFVESVRDS